MSLQCELSGEFLAASTDEIVVTPSGHICIKRLLLSRLAENRGVDPFHEDRPLSEDELVTLQVSKPAIVPPRTNQTNSMSGLLKTLQNEYDALVLELFDTRKTLEETRRELSQALYQNDAAMRVVARVAMERDQARQQLEEWKAGAGGQTADSANKKRKIDDDESKPSSLPLMNDIPKENLDSMIELWDHLHKSRKSLQKEAAAAAPSPEDVAGFIPTREEDWQKTGCEGVAAIALHGETVVTAGVDRSVQVFDLNSKKIIVSADAASDVNCIDINDKHIVAGCSNGTARVWKSNGDFLDVVETNNSESPIVAVNLHPDKKHILVASKAGILSLMQLNENNDVNLISTFKQSEDIEYTSGFLHPDGLIYVTSCANGKILLWDLKSRSMGGTLVEADNENDSVVNLHVSNSGYHIAAAYASGKVLVWDLRKQKVIATLNKSEDALETVLRVAFDPAGKYLVYGGKGGFRIVTVKEWDNITLAVKSQELTSGIVWASNWVATTSIQSRIVRLHGKEP